MRATVRILVVALAALVATVQGAQAGTFFQFLEINPQVQGFTATQNAGATATTITASDLPVITVWDTSLCAVAGCSGLGASSTGFLTFAATSQNAATDDGTGGISQSYNGIFTFWTGAGGTGTKLLSGGFTDQFTGNAGTNAAGLASGEAGGDIIAFNGGIFDLTLLQPFRGISLSFTSLIPGLHITGTTIASFNASGTGTFDANNPPPDTGVPEPASMLLLGTGLVGLAGRLRRKKA